MTTIYGSHPTTEKNFWAYAVAAGKVVLVRCATSDDAAEERERMKQSDATTVGSVTARQISELDMRTYCRSKGWKITVIR